MDSGLPQRQFSLFRNELYRLINQTDVGPSTNRFGLAQFGQDTQVEFSLNTHDSKTLTMKAVRNFKLQTRSGQPQSLSGALQNAAAQFFSAEVGGRAHLGAQQYLFVVTGQDFDGPVGLAARAVKSAGVIVGGVSASLSEEALSRFASPGFEFTSLKVTALKNIITSAVETFTEGEKASLVPVPVHQSCTFKCPVIYHILSHLFSLKQQDLTASKNCNYFRKHLINETRMNACNSPLASSL